MWYIKSEYVDRENRKCEQIQRVPATADVTDEITTAFRNILFETLANAHDDLSIPLTVTVMYRTEKP